MAFTNDSAAANVDQPTTTGSHKAQIDAAQFWDKKESSQSGSKYENLTARLDLSGKHTLTFDDPYKDRYDMGPRDNRMIYPDLRPNDGRMIYPDLGPNDNRVLYPNRGPKDGAMIYPDRNELPTDIKDLLYPHDRTEQPKQPLDPRAEADKRDADAMMDAMRNGKLDDLKHLVGDMSPEKLKRVTEQLKAEGFDMTTTKDGKFVVYNKELGLGVQVGPDGKADVVKKDKNGEFVKTDDGANPEKLLSMMGSQLPEDPNELIRKIEAAMEHHKPWDLEQRDPYHHHYWQVMDQDFRNHYLFLKDATSA